MWPKSVRFVLSDFEGSKWKTWKSPFASQGKFSKFLALGLWQIQTPAKKTVNYFAKIKPNLYVVSIIYLVLGRYIKQAISIFFQCVDFCAYLVFLFALKWVAVEKFLFVLILNFVSGLKTVSVFAVFKVLAFDRNFRLRQVIARKLDLDCHEKT